MLRLSQKHGVNPSVDHCFFCGESYAVALFGQLKGDAKAPRSVCTGDICDRCKKVREDGGVFLIEVDPEKTKDMKNPWRTGRMCAMKEEAIRRIFQPEEMADNVVEKGMAYVEVGVFDMIGVPKEDIG